MECYYSDEKTKTFGLDNQSSIRNSSFKLVS